jgi:RecB family exonuclease
MSAGALAVVSPRAEARVSAAGRWLARLGRATEVLIVAATTPAAADLARSAAQAMGGSFGWHRFTLLRLAWTLAETRLAEAGLVPVSALAFEAVCARVVHQAAGSGLGRFEPIADRPGLPRALARSFTELRLAKVHPRDLADADLAALFDAATAALLRMGLVDQPDLYTVATEVARAGHPTLGRPLLLLDVPIRTACERELVRALLAASPSAMVTAATGDGPTLAALADLGIATPSAELGGERRSLARLQEELFAKGPAELAPLDDSVTVFSAPGESRECVEIVRRIHRAAERGVPFDRMAIVLRSPLQYRAHLTEALRRGGVPVHFARGTTRPDPTGRAFLALLTCAATGLPASRFAEFLSLGEVAAAAEDGAPPAPLPPSDRWVPPDDGLLHEPAAEPDGAGEPDEAEQASVADPEAAPVVLGSLRAPRLWEQLLVDAAVIGGLPRWKRRLDGLRRARELALVDLDEADGPEAQAIRRDLDGLTGLTAYALPLLHDLDRLPKEALWGDWLERLGSLASRALSRPERVLSVLAELHPMASVGPVTLREVRLVLEQRLTEVAVPAAERRYGRVLVAGADDVRGQTFDLVFVPGLAEKLFPQRVVEDPIVPDRARRGTLLPTNHERAAAERLALRLAIGAASASVVLSYPRLDVEQARPRTPSFYGLEALRAAEGALPGFDELSRRADVTGAVRVGWPAPAQPSDAVDDAEHDLSLLDALLRQPRPKAQGMARYLLSANVHLERALRFREKRWRREWTDADGLLRLPPEAALALRAHALTARSYSPTGLQHYGSCPYRFVLQAIHRLSPREVPAPLEELDPLSRGSLIHEAQFALFTRLRDQHLLPVTPGNLEVVRGELDRVLGEVVTRYRDDLAPAIPRVWEDGVAAIRADMREWLRRASLDATWRPLYFELSFGLGKEAGRDARSKDEPAALDCGIQLRGSIDLVERDASGLLRASDYKTGKAHAKPGTVVKGGTVLQPVLYALALEKVLPGERVEGGSLYYCTSKGDFTSVPVPLDDQARAAATELATTLGDALDAGFLPAAPDQGACKYCDYQRVCGPYEEQRVTRKPKRELVPLSLLRRLP